MWGMIWVVSTLACASEEIHWAIHVIFAYFTEHKVHLVPSQNKTTDEEGEGLPKLRSEGQVRTGRWERGTVFPEGQPACAKAQWQECMGSLLILALGSLNDAPAPPFSMPPSTHLKVSAAEQVGRNSFTLPVCICMFHH